MAAAGEAMTLAVPESCAGGGLLALAGRTAGGLPMSHKPACPMQEIGGDRGGLPAQGLRMRGIHHPALARGPATGAGNGGPAKGPLRTGDDRVAPRRARCRPARCRPAGGRIGGPPRPELRAPARCPAPPPSGRLPESRSPIAEGVRRARPRLAGERASGAQGRRKPLLAESGTAPRSGAK